MRRLQPRFPDSIRAAALCAALAIVVAACSSSANAGWTYAPEPSITPAPSASSSAGPSAAPSAAPSESGSAAPSGSGGGTAISIKAQNIAFDPTTLDAPAGQAFTINFDNEDAGIPHNIQILDASGASMFKGDIFNGAATKAYSVPALTAGAYKFMCDVHPNMVGSLTVK